MTASYQPVAVLSSVRSAGDAQWLTAQQIADLRLDGLPTTKRNVNRRALAENWTWRPNVGRGGGRLYDATRLPEPARSDFLSRVATPRRPVGRPAGNAFADRHPEVIAAIEALIAPGPVSSRNLLKLLAADGVSPLPSRRALQRIVADLERRRAVEFTAMRDPDRARSRHRPALGRMDATVGAAHEMWEIDTTRVDVMCTDGRKCVLGIIDRWSRRARFLVVDSESAQSVRRILAETMSAWGVMPGVLKVDNGSGFVNATIRSALDLLGITLDACLPGHPEDKPHVERLFGTFMRERASLLPGFLGHNVADAQRLRARAKRATGRAEIAAGIDSIELQARIDAWVDGEYHRRVHSSLRMSPMEKWQRSPGIPRAAPDAGALRLALSAFAGHAVVGKRGVRWKNGRYWSAALVPVMDQKVVLRRDEDDLGALFVFDLDGNYIDTAVNAARSGLSERDFALAARRDYESYIKAAHAEIRAKQRRYSPERMRDAMLRQEAEDAGRVVHLPTPARHEHSPAIAAMTTRSAVPVPAAPFFPELAADQLQPRHKPAADPRTAADKAADADAVLAAHARGEAVDPSALERARLYATTPEYQTHKIMTAHFGGPATNPGEPLAIRA